MQKYNLCNEYRLEYGEIISFHFTKTVPLSECLKDGNFIFTANEILELRRAYKKAKLCYEDTCDKRE
jgi:hypothetical protein